MDEEGHVDASVFEVALTAWGDAAVVGEVEDDGVVGESLFFQGCKDFAHALIHEGDHVVVGGDVVADFGKVWKVRAEKDLVGRDARFRWDEAFFAAVSNFRFKE